jgi:hypothetical protein
MVKKLNLTPEDVDGKRWNVSVPKLIDNAIIGMLKYLDDNKSEEFKSKLQELRRN